MNEVKQTYRGYAGDTVPLTTVNQEVWEDLMAGAQEEKACSKLRFRALFAKDGDVKRKKTKRERIYKNEFTTNYSKYDIY